MAETVQELKARLAAAEQRAKIAEEKLATKRVISFKVSEKGALSVYGLGRFPVTLYIGQWERLIAAVPALQTFASENAGGLSRKE